MDIFNSRYASCFVCHYASSGRVHAVGWRACSEIEVLSKNQNIALGASVTMSSRLACSQSRLARITVGLNYYGAILPIRERMKQLALSHDLETERPVKILQTKERRNRAIHRPYSPQHSKADQTHKNHQRLGFKEPERDKFIPLGETSETNDGAVS